MTFLYIFIFCFLISLGQCHANKSINNRPVIAVLAQRHPIDGSHSYIAASYVKYLESAGARVVPIPHYFSESTIRYLFKYLNGVLFPGGNAYWFTSPYYKHAKLFWELAIEANNKGDYFPIWGTCFGFQTMHTILVNKRIRAQRPADDESMPLKFVTDVKSSRLFKDMPEDLLKIVKTDDVTYNHHSYGITRRTYALNSALNKFFKILTVNNDVNGDEFISTVEVSIYLHDVIEKFAIIVSPRWISNEIFNAFHYPFYGVQWHPEKPAFEFGIHYKNIPHSYNSIRVAQYMANFFVNEAKKSFHAFPSKEVKYDYMVYKYNPFHSAGRYKKSTLRYFEQVYLFE